MAPQRGRHNHNSVIFGGCRASCFHDSCFHLSTGAWRNPSADKTPKPERIHIKEATLAPSSPPALSLSFPRPCVAAFICRLSMVPARLPPRHHRRYHYHPPPPSSSFLSPRVGRRSTGGCPQVTRGKNREKLQSSTPPFSLHPRPSPSPSSES